MRILASDYDGTLNPFYFRPIFTKNIAGIQNFKANGNLFIIATARKPMQFINEINNYSIPYDYIICDNGNIILDNCGNIVHMNYVTESEISFFLDIIECLYGIKNINFFDMYGNPTLEMPYGMEVETDRFIKSSSFKDLEFGMKINIFLKKILISHRCNKKDGLLTLLRILKLEVEHHNIYTVGNSMNDIEMLKRFNGYKVPYSNPYLLLDHQIPMIDSVYSLTKKIQSSRK